MKLYLTIGLIILLVIGLVALLGWAVEDRK